MIPQMILPPERFSADIAGIRSFVRMRPLVNQEIVAFSELPIAKLANKLFLGPLSGQSPGKKGGGRRYRKRGMQSLMTLVMMMMMMMIRMRGRCLRATTPDSEQRGSSEPIIQECGLIADILSGRLLLHESTSQLLRPDPPGRRDLHLMMLLYRSVQCGRRMRRCQRFHLRLHRSGNTDGNHKEMDPRTDRSSLTLG